MDSAWKSKASAVHAARPTRKKIQSFKESWANREKGFCSGAGDCHSVRSSPYSLVTTTRCFQMKRSPQACFAVNQIPLDMGSAGSPSAGMMNGWLVGGLEGQGEGSEELAGGWV